MRDKDKEILSAAVPLTLEELREMEGEPIWIQAIGRPDLSQYHFIVRDETAGLAAKDGRGVYEKGRLYGCYFDIEHGHHYGVNWLAYRRKPVK